MAAKIKTFHIFSVYA
jgi:hypothetical protein